MKILQVSTFDRLGGACIAGFRQHQALLRDGVDSQMWVRFKVTNDPSVSQFNQSHRIWPRAIRFFQRYLFRYQWHQAAPKTYMFDPRSEYYTDFFRGMPETDLVNIQFAWEFLDYSSFFRSLPANIPIVVTMHSMESFTGGCAYTAGCSRFYDQCKECPQLSRPSPYDLTYQGWLRRNNSYALRDKRKIHFVANSEWLAIEAKKSGLLQQYPVSVIHYGVDTEKFLPLDRVLARKILGIPLNSAVVAFAAASVSNPRKGFSVLMEAIQKSDKKPFLLTWGGSIPRVLEGFPGLHLGNLVEERLCALALNAADVFVLPSLEEAFGQTALEAIACGTPVVAFKTGGIPEVVRHEINGILAESGSPLELGFGISRLLTDQDLWRQCSINGIEIAKSEFSFALNAKKYRLLYDSLIR